MPPSITTERFKFLIKGIHEDITDRELCFVLGAGASVSAGILSGGALAERWLGEMPEKIGQTAFDEWKENELTKAEKQLLAQKDYGQLYSTIYRKRFEFEPQSGYHYLLEVMKGKHPGNGHIILSQILRYTRHRCVVTTNFDSLLETAIFRYTNTQPLVCGHEALAQYARPTKDIPLVVKVHRDLLTAPKSSPDEIDALDISWQPVLDHIFHQRTPVIIGYGGNDGSLMNYFENMSKPDNFFWCLYKNEKPSPRIEKLVEKHKGVFIRHDGFDELLRELLVPFSNVQGNLKSMETENGARIADFNKWLLDGQEMLTTDTSKPETKKKPIDKKQKPLSAWEYKTKADAELDLEKREKIYEEALLQYPKTAWLWGSMAYFKQFEKKDFTNLDEYYNQALKLGLDESWFYTNYALYLESIKKDHPKAEEYYLKALALEPDGANTNGNYAVFLNDVKKDYPKVEEYLLKALAAEPNHSTNNGNYASFLNDIKKDYPKAEEYYLKALALEPNNANNYGNYALFLSDIKKDYPKAEQYYLKALAAEPNHANDNANYAVFLNDVKKDYPKAEEYYLKAHAADPNHANNNANYALFLKDIKKDYPKAEEFYLRVLAVSPDHPNSNCNYAQLLLQRGKKKEAEKYLEKAFANCEADILLLELWFYRYAHFTEYLKEAKKKMDELLAKGVRSTGWDFSGNIDQAMKDKHPEPDKLKEYAKRISE